MTPKSYKLLIVAGEASGDAHAADLIREMRDRDGVRQIDVFGATGPKMRAVGVETVVRADDFAVVGVPEILRALPRFLRAYASLFAAARSRRPDAVVLVDFPEFNMKFARSVRRLGIPVIYFISPQLWAWRRYRLRGIKRDVDILLSIFPFEKSWYEEHGYHEVFYVGNPTSKRIAEQSNHDSSRSHIALLPGSRITEIRRILPTMLAAADLISVGRPDLRFRIAAASAEAKSEIESLLTAHISDSRRGTVSFSVETDSFDRIVSEASAVAVASGTATLEAALLNTPMVVVYRSSWLNYLLLRPLISVPFFSLVNLIAGRKLAEELIQSDCSPRRLARELLSLLDPERNKDFRVQLSEVRKKLSSADDGKGAAERILEFLESRDSVN